MNTYRCARCDAHYHSAAELKDLYRLPCRQCGSTALIPVGVAERPKGEQS